MSELIGKLINIQNKLDVPKSKYNSYGGFYYRSVEDILEAVKPLNAEWGLLLTLTDEPLLIGERYYIKATVSLTDGNESHVITAYARESENKKGMDDSQITGTASSYARKYALNGLYLIDDTKDADTDEYANQNQQNKPNKASDKQLNYITKLINQKVNDKYNFNSLHELIKKRIGTENDMENWTGEQASQAIKKLQGDKND